jgi:hypothetical protein
MSKSSGIVVILLLALLLGTLASIKAQTHPLIESALVVDDSVGPHNPNLPQDEPAVRSGGS